ncbi:RNA polymerase sigma factor [Candidatus Woesearchaeota archaeon]|nr:MAG: RNA polymerase sigma factor [Candidatus Woesearchaeota archaeon]
MDEEIRRKTAALADDRAYFVAYAQTLVGNTEDAEDLVHTAYVKAIPHIDAVRNLRPWMTTVILNAFRSQSRRKRALPLEEVLSEPAEPFFEVSDGIRAVFSQLADGEKQVLESYLEGQSYGAIAQEQEISKSQLRGRLYRLKQAVRARLAYLSVYL